MRAFVAIDLDPAIKEAILKLIRQLKTHSGDIKWSKPKSMHLTLKFLGEIKPELCSAIENEVKNVCADFPPFKIHFKGIETFPSAPSRPRIIWAGIENAENLISLQQSIEARLARLDLPLEKRKYTPHLTLGRVKSSYNLNETLSQLQNVQSLSFGIMLIDQIILYKSSLKPSGAEYSQIFTVSLK